MEKSVMKFYMVEVRYWPSIDMAYSNTYTKFAAEKPQAETFEKGAMMVHRVYFEDPVKAEDYRQRVMADYEGRDDHEDLQQG